MKLPLLLGKNHPAFATSREVLLGLALVSALLAPPASRAEISEPDTIFYGKIVNRTSGEEYVLKQGTLSWVIKRPDGRLLTLSASLQPLKNGTYSYQLKVPHQALTYGLTVSSAAVPLSAQPATCSHVQITVDGSAASVMAPGSSSFIVAQNLRASTYRLDLELFNPMPDTAGNSLPDWWKTLYGVSDPNADPMGDGWSNLQKFLIGANPNQDNRIPTLQTSELFVYADGTTGIRLQAIDSDSGPSNLFYTITALPQSGGLYLRQAANTSSNAPSPLGIGASFTQDDVNQGRLTFVHQATGSPVTTDSLQVSLRDENSNHPATNGAVALNVYRPSYPDATMQLAAAMAAAPASATNIAGLSFDEQQMVLNYFLSRNQGYVIWDGSRGTLPQTIAVPSSGLTQAGYAQYVAAYGRDRQYVLTAGAGVDHLAGGMESDILIAGRGGDTLRGNGGSDLFVIPGPGAGSTTIEDFNLAENDALDISRVLLGTSTSLANYLQVTNSGNDSFLLINSSGAGPGSPNLVVTLRGTQIAQADLQTLADNGNLITGQKLTLPRVSILASVGAASQNGPLPGQFTLTRIGGIASPLTVNLQITGSAVDGTDYQYIAPQVNFAAGQQTVTVSIRPYLNNSTVPQVVQIAVATGSGYEVANGAVAQVAITPLSPQISIQAIQPVASRQDQVAGVFLLTRGGVINSSVLVRLTLGGTAPSSHYAPISPYINLLPQQTTALITVTPTSVISSSNSAEFVQISIQPDPSYVVMNASSDRVAIIDRLLTFARWQQANFPANTDDPAIFANEDPGNKGIRAIFRYAYGLNPQNPQASPGIPGYQIRDDHLAVSFKHPAAITDLSYLVEVSDDLLHWRSSSNDIEPLILPAFTNDAEAVSFRSTSAVSVTPKLFMRVRVVPQP